MIAKWMLEEPVEVITSWKVGAPVIFRGKMSGKPFSDKGIVLAFEPGEVLRYSLLNEVSELPDIPSNYSVVEFLLRAEGTGTNLTLTHSNLVAEAAEPHAKFYWRTALAMIKQQLEGSVPSL
jgi:hypothetical protein